MTDFSMVEDVGTIAAELGDSQCIGLDTEFMREKTFFAELCLVQISTHKEIYCIDPLARTDMSQFWASAMQTPWVVHSARQDIEVIYQAAEQMPVQLFDTQIAAGLLGHAPQMGYATLVSELFDVEIPKSHTRADWSRRPLSDAVMQYAAEDVEYLLPARDILAEQLDKLNRLQWADEDSAMLLDPALYDIDPQAAIKRLKGARNMRGRKRSAAARLAAWRESEALRANRPRQWIARDSALLEIAFSLPTTKQQLEAMDDLPAGLVRRSGQRLLEVVAESAADDHNHRPPSAPNEEQKALLKKMQAHVADCAEALGLSAEIIAPKKELSAVIIGGDRDSRVFSGWRRELVGDDLLKLL
ncbi:MAG: ribonuclease D [Woeseiaceae bacterium]